MAGPVIAERKDGGTPWHAHHIAERYGLFVIIALGEGVVGTVASLSAVIEGQGWTLDAPLVCIAGTGLTFGMWWMYYIMPSAESPRPPQPRLRLGLWADAHLRAIVATGAGLHVAAYYIEHKAHIGAVATVLTVAVPVCLSADDLRPLHLLSAPGRPFHLWLLAGTAVVLAASVMAAMAGVDMAVCLIILMFAPIVTVIGYEIVGHRHRMEAIARAIGEPS